MASNQRPQFLLASPRLPHGRYPWLKRPGLSYFALYQPELTTQILAFRTSLSLFTAWGRAELHRGQPFEVRFDEVPTSQTSGLPAALSLTRVHNKPAISHLFLKATSPEVDLPANMRFAGQCYFLNVVTRVICTADSYVPDPRRHMFVKRFPAHAGQSGQTNGRFVRLPLHDRAQASAYPAFLRVDSNKRCDSPSGKTCSLVLIAPCL